MNSCRILWNGLTTVSLLAALGTVALWAQSSYEHVYKTQVGLHFGVLKSKSGIVRIYWIHARPYRERVEVDAQGGGPTGDWEPAIYSQVRSVLFLEFDRNFNFAQKLGFGLLNDSAGDGVGLPAVRRFVIVAAPWWSILALTLVIPGLWNVAIPSPRENRGGLLHSLWLRFASNAQALSGMRRSWRERT